MRVVRLRGRGDVETRQRPLSCHLVEQILQSRHGSVAQPAPPLHSLGKTAGEEQQETFQQQQLAKQQQGLAMGQERR